MQDFFIDARILVVFVSGSMSGEPFILQKAILDFFVVVPF